MKISTEKQIEQETDNTMTNSTKYFAFQDTAAGFIQWVGAGKDEIGVATSFKNDVGFDETPEEILEDVEVTELTAEQYQKLENVAGDDQGAIDLLESWKD